MKRRILLISLLHALVFWQTGCWPLERSAYEKPEEKVSVVTTVFAPYDFTREIAGDNASVTMLLPPAVESHSFEPTSQDIIRIQDCELFIYVGGESEHWVGEILSSMEDKPAQIITLMDCVDAVEEEIVEGMEDVENDAEAEAHGQDHTHATVYDEHIWTSPQNAKLIVQKIADALCLADAANTSIYQQNTAAYLERLNELDAAFQSVVNNALRKTLVFGDRFPFRYLTEAYGLDYYAAFPGCAAQTEPSAKTVIFLIEKIKAEQIPVVLHAEMSNGKMANTISGETGAKVLMLHACHTLSRDEFLSGVSYMDLMTRNVAVLQEALH